MCERVTQSTHILYSELLQESLASTSILIYCIWWIGRLGGWLAPSETPEKGDQIKPLLLA